MAALHDSDHLDSPCSVCGAGSSFDTHPGGQNCLEYGCGTKGMHPKTNALGRIKGVALMGRCSCAERSLLLYYGIHDVKS